MYTSLLNVTSPGKFKTDNVVGVGKEVIHYLVVSIYLSMGFILQLHRKSSAQRDLRIPNVE